MGGDCGRWEGVSIASGGIIVPTKQDRVLFLAKVNTSFGIIISIGAATTGITQRHRTYGGMVEGG